MQIDYITNYIVLLEAAFIPECVWNSIIPALAITRGAVWLLSTPFIKEGYYYNCFSDPTFTEFHTTSEDCPRRDDAFLAHKKATLSRAEYAQMYLGKFVDELRRVFSDDLIRATCIAEPIKMGEIRHRGQYYIGCDVARGDKDQFTYEIGRKVNNKLLVHVENIATTDVPLPTSAQRIIDLDQRYSFASINIDSGGMGIAICDMLRDNSSTKRKVVEINNASRPFTPDGRTKKILKEDLYANLLRLMQKGEIQLLNDDEVKSSLRSMQKEYNKETGRLKISSPASESHITEGLIRMAWCMRQRKLNIWVRT